MDVNSFEKKCVENFLDKISSVVTKDVNTNYEYDENTDTFVIYHNINFENAQSTKELIGLLISECLLENDIYNFSLEFNAIKAINWTQSVSFILGKIKTSINSVRSTESYSYSMNCKPNFVPKGLFIENPVGIINSLEIEERYSEFRKSPKIGQEVLAA